MLKTKLKFLHQDRSGREVVVQDSTGLVANGVIDGYQNINNILSYYFSASGLVKESEYLFKIDGSDTYLPSLTNIAQGLPLTLKTEMFDEGDRSEIFKDGLLDLNMYVEFTGMTGVVIEKGTDYIVGGVFTEMYKADSVVINDVIYPIKKESVNTNGDTVLYIIGEFEDNATSFTIAYRSNIKTLLTTMSEHYHAYACKYLSDSIDSPEWNKVNTATSFRESARILLNQTPPDFSAADDMVKASFKLLNKYANDNC